MLFTARTFVLSAALAAVVGAAVDTRTLRFVETDLVVNHLVNGVPTLTDQRGVVHVAQFYDPHLVNPWGLATSTTSPFWVSDNGAGVSTLYGSGGTPLSLVVSIPSPADPLGSGGTPTGAVFNTAAASQQAFKITGVSITGAPISAPALFLFATEDGTVVGWNPNVNPPGFDPAKSGTYGIIAIDRSTKPGAVYKGLTMATNPSSGETLLYVTNFHAGTVEVFDSSFNGPRAGNLFSDPKIPARYAPFNIGALPINGSTELFVTYAVQDSDKHDDVAGQGHGIVDTFDLTGQAGVRFAQHGQLDSPWGLEIAQSTFSSIAGDVLVGNFGNGHINAYAPDGSFVEKLRSPHGNAIVIPGLWALRVGNGGNGGVAGELYFTAGPNDEQDGLFGRLTPEP